MAPAMTNQYFKKTKKDSCLLEEDLGKPEGFCSIITQFIWSNLKEMPFFF